MTKLLLLTMSMVSFSLKDYAAGSTSKSESDSIRTDSAKTDTISDPKDGFKNLFITNTAAKGLSGARLNPMAISFVQDYVRKFSESLNKMKGWGRPHFELMDRILMQYGLPDELKYLSVIESELKSYAVSWAGAVGPWQFMPATARNLGLRVSGSVDERTDLRKSTKAAAKYLSQLYSLYGDWLLVIAAYNGGPGAVNSAIRRSGSRNFWHLQNYLPAESRKHVKKFIATHYIMEGEGGITTVTKKEANELQESQNTAPEVNAELSVLSISGKYNSIAIAQHLQMTTTEFNKLNPGFDKYLAANNSVGLRLPADKLLLFQANRPQILEQSIKLLLAMDGR